MEDVIDRCVDCYKHNRHILQHHMDNVSNRIRLEPRLNSGPLHVVHSIKSRLKDVDHLRDKLRRLAEKGEVIGEDQVLSRVTDLAGVRVMHLYLEQFGAIHEFIMEVVSGGEWVLAERPRAYSWDPEAVSVFNSLGIEVKMKDTYYTSVHYLIKPSAERWVCCELQVRTLFEEIWGEIDHSLNYPHQNNDVAVTEQIKVLSRLVSTGSSLATSIFRVARLGGVDRIVEKPTV